MLNLYYVFMKKGENKKQQFLRNLKVLMKYFINS